MTLFGVQKAILVEVIHFTIQTLLATSTRVLQGSSIVSFNS